MGKMFNWRRRNMKTIAITITETQEHHGHDIGIGVSLGDDWIEYHGDGKNVPHKNTDSQNSRTWICKIDDNEIKSEIRFCFYNLCTGYSRVFENELIPNKIALNLRKYNEKNLPDKLDNVTEIAVDYWVRAPI